MLGDCFREVLALSLLGGCWLVESTPEPSYEKIVLADAPLGYWRVGEREAPAVDASGHGYHGEYVNGATFGRPGAIIGDSDAAVLLVHQQIGLSSASDLQPWAGDFTIEAWVVPHAASGGLASIFIAETYPTAGFRSGWQDEFAPMFWTDQTTGSLRLISPELMSRDAWNHVVFVKAGPMVAIYLNGRVTISKTDPKYVPPAANAIVCWGACEAVDTDGDFDELAIYDRALTDAEIARHYEAGTN